MSTYDLTVGAGIPALADWREFIATATFDATAQNLAQNDIAQLIKVPAKTLITGVFWEVETVEGASRNFAIGDGSDTDGYIASTTANSLASGASIPAVTAGTAASYVAATLPTFSQGTDEFTVGTPDTFVQGTDTFTQGTLATFTPGAAETITGYSAGKYYSATDTIDLLAVTSGGLTACTIRVIARGYNFAQ